MGYRRVPVGTYLKRHPTYGTAPNNCMVTIGTYSLIGYLHLDQYRYHLGTYIGTVGTVSTVYGANIIK